MEETSSKTNKANWEASKDKANAKTQLDRVQSFEEAFQQIKAATGIDNIDELVQTLCAPEHVFATDEFGRQKTDPTTVLRLEREFDVSAQHAALVVALEQQVEAAVGGDLVSTVANDVTNTVTFTANAGTDQAAVVAALQQQGDLKEAPTLRGLTEYDIVYISTTSF